MIVTEIIGNIHQSGVLKELEVETVEIENEALAKRIHHLVTNKGTSVSIRLPKGRHLHAGDILVEEEKRRIIVDVLPEDVLVIVPTTVQMMGEIAHELGNRHLPAQFFENQMIIQYDYLVEQLLQQKKIPFSRESKKLSTAFRHIGHSHDE